MFDDPNLRPPPRKGMSIYVLATLTVFGLAVVYLAGVFYTRWHGDRLVQEQTAAAKREQDQRVFQMMGGDRFDILKFFPYPGGIKRGDSTMLCYSVSNAKSVTLEPQSNAVWPAFERCVSVAPKKTTTYTLTAMDAAGHTKSATVTVEVR
ncbi:MAG TPA: hypothetical protein VNV41_17355 [Candidatus Acidoferrales bacterium]|nr:hypothetical protein [Candidatus Acidoferrales bacterium]